MSDMYVINGTNLSHAWAQAFLKVVDAPSSEISPFVLNLVDIGNGTIIEDSVIRSLLDQSLVGAGKIPTEAVANTIFPISLWRYARPDRKKFYNIYKESLPRYKALVKPQYRRGEYFERLIDYDGNHAHSNQLEYLISEYAARPGVRRSMFQASIFDPKRDHVRNAQLAFPCLQHISFIPEGKDLALNAFYATQQVFERAYGNYLGLCRLGQFVAEQMGLTFARFTCFAGVEKLNKKPAKGSEVITKLAQAARDIINTTR